MVSGQAQHTAAAQLGRRGEALAQSYLTRLGYSPLVCNFRCPGGEIDLIAWEAEVLCFVEVRTRATAAHGDPLETVDAAKRARLVRAARAFLSQLAPPWPLMRFDAVGVLWPDAAAAGPPSLTLVRDAFEV